MSQQGDPFFPDQPDPPSNTTDLHEFSFDDFLAEEEIIGDVVDDATKILKRSIEALQEVAYDPRSGPRQYIKRPREQYHRLLVDDYFSVNPLYPANIFRRRFRMSRPFLRIVDELSKWSDYITTKVDALHRQGLTPLQKCTVAIRQLANGSTADHLDEHLKIGESIGLEAMKMFVKGVIAVFGEYYLRCPTVECLLNIGESRSFPGMFQCLGALTVCNGSGNDIPMYGRANSLMVIKKSQP
ncbi:uncharacterized protein LOC112877808 [Panicum hallii]|jgi:hypothetical protein|uniref:uncharacterized protein LOC112877808 n=1 Tax=Panicum hallii TaxID=206008 RepID=UPI000DF4EA5D|nr:uncharacterized protein LOC112877808 [Panicum hallii]